MTDPRHALGLAAEEAVASWLASCGWRVLGRRRRSRGGGEVDVLARDPAGVLVAVEVRARRSVRAGDSASSVSPARLQRLRYTLAALAATGGEHHRGLRVDLVTVEPMAGLPGVWRLSRIPVLE